MKKTAPKAGLAHLQAVLAERIPTYRGGQKALAHDLGVSESTISHLASGVRGTRISPDNIVALARIWGITTDQLLGVEPIPPVAIDIAALDDAIERAREMLAALERIQAAEE